ncbi:hypothetical protein [Pseudonocardia adelaidensis]|uniref:SPW repeat-containing protein n=1 Tax=Pseudonocardia adelaidensis TaxID=648754 RepID=A0ABP9P3Q8_9PSEU
MFRILADRLRRTVLVSLVVSAVGIPVQILGGWDYPVVPPGMLILLVAGAAALLPVRWAPAISLVAGGFILVGFFVVGDAANMLGSQNALVTVGKWVQMVALVVGVVAAVGSLAKPPVPLGRDRTRPA